jgi:hypothetical protein
MGDSKPDVGPATVEPYGHRSSAFVLVSCRDLERDDASRVYVGTVQSALQPICYPNDALPIVDREAGRFFIEPSRDPQSRYHGPVLRIDAQNRSLLLR